MFWHQEWQIKTASCSPYNKRYVRHQSLLVCPLETRTFRWTVSRSSWISAESGLNTWRTGPWTTCETGAIAGRCSVCIIYCLHTISRWPVLNIFQPYTRQLSDSIAMTEAQMRRYTGVWYSSVRQEGQHPLTGQRAASFRLLANQWAERRLVMQWRHGCRAMRRIACNAGASNAGQSFCVQISRERSYSLPLYWYHSKGNWLRNNFAAEFLYNETLQQTFRPLLSKLPKRRQI